MAKLEFYRKIIEPYKYIVTIDPGARDGGGTGIAFFNSDYKIAEKSFLTKLLISKEPDWLAKVDDIADQLYALLSAIKYPSSKNYFKASNLFFIEKPAFFDSFKGLTTARSDALFKLCFLTGRLFGVIRSFNYDCVLLPVVDWKGQMTKKMVQSRIEHFCGKDVVQKNDIDDAVGMGLFLKGCI